MKKTLFTMILSVFLVSSVWAAFISNVTILEKPDMLKLSDEKLIDAYEDVAVELEAIRTYHSTSSFTPKQYDEYRALLKYRLQLLMEIHTRNIELPVLLERY